MSASTHNVSTASGMPSLSESTVPSWASGMPSLSESGSVRLLLAALSF